MKKIIISLLFCNIVTNILAQNVEMADQFRADGKIYVVVAIMLIILVGIFYYLIRLETKLKKLEKK